MMRVYSGSPGEMELTAVSNQTWAMAVFDAPRGTGPCGITTTSERQVFFVSLAGNYLGRIDIETAATTV
jgi:streptogramin lyase